MFWQERWKGQAGTVLVPPNRRYKRRDSCWSKHWRGMVTKRPGQYGVGLRGISTPRHGCSASHLLTTPSLERNSGRLCRLSSACRVLFCSIGECDGH